MILVCRGRSRRVSAHLKVGSTLRLHRGEDLGSRLRVHDRRALQILVVGPAEVGADGQVLLQLKSVLGEARASSVDQGADTARLTAGVAAQKFHLLG